MCFCLWSPRCVELHLPHQLHWQKKFHLCNSFHSNWQRHEEGWGTEEIDNHPGCGGGPDKERQLTQVYKEDNSFHNPRDYANILWKKGQLYFENWNITGSKKSKGRKSKYLLFKGILRGVYLQCKMLWKMVLKAWDNLLEKKVARAFVHRAQVTALIYGCKGGDEFMQERNRLSMRVRKLYFLFYG